MRAGIVALLAAVAGTTPVPAAQKTFHSADWHLTIRYPADLVIARSFKKNYFTDGAWRMSYAAGSGPGEAIIAFSLPDRRSTDAGGDRSATLELTIGGSRDRSVVASCLTYGMNSGNNVEVDHRSIGGVVFTEVPDNSDGGSMQHIQSDDLRAVHDGACYAIDIVEFTGGTSAKPLGFSASDVDRLKSLLNGIIFD